MFPTQSKFGAIYCKLTPVKHSEEKNLGRKQMEKVEQTICIYMIWLLFKISISYIAWKALNKNPTSCLPQISRTGGDALMAKCPPNPGTAQHRVGGSSISCSSPVLLAHFWDAVGRGTGKRLLSVRYLLLIALNRHQGPELLCVCGWWRNVAIFPFIYSPSLFFLSMKL